MHIDPDRLQLSNPTDMQKHRMLMGNGRYPALVVDNLYRDPDHVRQVALGLHYLSPAANHPGYIAVLGLSMEPLLSFLHACFADFYVPSLESLLYRAQPWVFYRCDPAGSRRPRPTAAVPHTDLTLLGGLVYLNLPSQCRGGTGFYRHVETGAEAIIQKDVIAGRNGHVNLDEDVVAKMKNLGAFEPYLRWKSEGHGSCYDDYSERIHTTPGAENDYLVESTAEWELTQVVEMKYNRLVLFPAFFLHSPHYRPEWFGDAPHECRLTQNIFLRWPEKAAS